MNAYAQKEQKASSEKDKTGIPAQMKAKFERSSGFSFDDVRVHYNSEKPAQLHAHAYTQGSEVFVAPGQEKHLPHELGHVIQQKSNAVKPTGEVGGMPLNDDEAMESGADKLAEEAESTEESDEVPLQAKAKEGGVIQRDSQYAYNVSAGPITSALGILGGIGALGSFLYSKNSSRKHKYIDEIEKYADAACEAQEEQTSLVEGYNNAAAAAIPPRIRGQLKKLSQKIIRNYEAALSKAHAMGEFEQKKDRRNWVTGLFATTKPTGNPPKANNLGERLNNVQDKNVKAALLRAKKAYGKRWTAHGAHRRQQHQDNVQAEEDLGFGDLFELPEEN